MLCEVNQAYLKKVCRKALIAVGKQLADKQPGSFAGGEGVLAQTRDLAMQTGRELHSVLQASLPIDSWDCNEQRSLIEVRNASIRLVHLDGREGYVFGQPNFALGIDVECEGEVLFAGVFNPFYKVFFFTENGKCVKRNNTTTKVNEVQHLRDGFVGFAYRGEYDQEGQEMISALFSVMRTPVRTMLPGSDLYGLSLVANGNLSAMVIAAPNSDVVAPGIALVMAAGGKVSDRLGEPFTASSKWLLASNGQLHAELLQQFEFSETL